MRTVLAGENMNTNSTSMRSIVVIEDNNEYLNSLLDLLARFPGVTTAAAGGSGKDACALCARYAPDILLLSSGLADYGAFSAAALIRISHPEIMIILMCSEDTRDLRMLKQNTPFDHIISQSDIKSSLTAILADLNSDTLDRKI